ncbi:MAG: PEP-CTERM sorting domain-containing protein [Deltaproteobacteria bacterium]|nr:PEP-CTERM sorting domain-containing protein [Deltaproteobacteria bacterium]
MKRRTVIVMLACALVCGLSGLSFAAVVPNLISNGTFDSGLVSWNPSGDVVVGTGGTGVLSGNYALLGANSTDGNSSINQYFNISDGTTQLAVSFSYRFTGVDTSYFSSDRALATLTQFIGGWSATTEMISERSSEEFITQGVYSGIVDVANWLWWDATSGNLRFTLSESSPYSGWFWTDGVTNSSFAIDNVSVAAVPEPTTMLLLGLGLVGLAASRRRK